MLFEKLGAIVDIAVNYDEDVGFGAMSGHFFWGKFLELSHCDVCQPISSELNVLVVGEKEMLC